MIVLLSIFISLILNTLIFSPFMRLIKNSIDYSIIKSFSSIELNFIMLSFSILIPSILLYIILRKYKFEQKLKDLKNVKTLISILFIILIIYILTYILATTVPGGGLPFAIRMIFGKMVFPVLLVIILLIITFIIQRLVKTRKNKYEIIPFTNKEKKILKISLIISILIPLIIVLKNTNIIYKSLKIDNEFETLCQNAKTIIHKKENIDSIFINSMGSNEYLDIQKNGRYRGFGGGHFSYHSILNDYNVKIESINTDNKTKKEFPYIHYENVKTDKNQNSKLTKNITSNYIYDEANIYSDNHINGTLILIKNIKTNEIIAESQYYENTKARKICSDLIRQASYAIGKDNDFKSKYLLFDVLKDQKKINYK